MGAVGLGVGDQLSAAQARIEVVSRGKFDVEVAADRAANAFLLAFGRGIDNG